MNVDIDTAEIEEYAAKIARHKLRDQMKTFVAGEMEALKNFSQLRNDVWSLHGEIRKLNERVAKLERRKWWKS